MSSWRDQTSEQAQSDLDDLLDLALRTAQEQLDLAGEFYPFAVALGESGEPGLVQPPLRTQKDVADVAEVHERCWRALQEDAESLRAAAVVTNVVVSDGDAIAVALEHREGPAMTVFLPYDAQGKTNGKKPAQKHLFGDLSAMEGQPRLWA